MINYSLATSEVLVIVVVWAPVVGGGLPPCPVPVGPTPVPVGPTPLPVGLWVYFEPPDGYMPPEGYPVGKETDPEPRGGLPVPVGPTPPPETPVPVPDHSRGHLGMPAEATPTKAARKIAEERMLSMCDKKCVEVGK